MWLNIVLLVTSSFQDSMRESIRNLRKYISNYTLQAHADAQFSFPGLRPGYEETSWKIGMCDYKVFLLYTAMKRGFHTLKP